MPLLDRQSSITPQRGMPTEERNSSASPVTISSETVQFYYSNAGIRTIDAGQAAGTYVVGVLVLHPVMNSEGSMQASNLDTSLSFTSTALTTEVPFPQMVGESADQVSWSKRLAYIIESGVLTTNGQYCVDYAHGIIYGIKASTQTTLTATTYKVPNSAVPTVPLANTPAILSPTTGDTVIAANPNRRMWSIQNLGTNTLFVRRGASATTSVFHHVLKAGTGTDDGTGGSVGDYAGVIYTGAISVAGTSPRCVITEE